MPSNAQWIENHLKYLQGLKNVSQQQQRFIELATMDKRSAADEKKFKAALKLEKLAQQMVNAKAEMARLNTSAKREARKARDHELYNSAGLLIMAGLVDTKTGKPLIDKAELLGAMMGLANVPPNDKRREEWKKVGDEKLASMKTEVKKKSAEVAS